MSGFRFVLDVALFPMSIFSPIGILLLVFANAVLQWVPGHADLLPRLFGLLAPGGVLAVLQHSSLAILFVFANAVLVFAIIASARKRKKEQEKIEQKLRNQMDAQASREKQDPKP